MTIRNRIPPAAPRTAPKSVTFASHNGHGKSSKQGLSQCLKIGIASILIVALIVVEVSLFLEDSETGIGSLRSSSRSLAAVPFNGYGSRKKTTKCAKESKKLFYVEGDNKINQPPTRALRIQGWKKTDHPEEAHVIWTYVATSWWFDMLLPHQRYNHIPNHNLWNEKDSFISYMLDYALLSGKELAAVPETYRLDEEEGIVRFKKRLFEEGGLDTPWVLKKPNVNQGRGITMLGPRTPELKNVFETVKAEEHEQNYIIQKYICNEMTIDKRKFDFRVFWIVASLDPLIVMYHDGYLRIGNSEYTEGNFTNTQSHLTTHTGLASEGKGTWEQFSKYVADVNQQQRLGFKDPIGHVRKQVMQVLGEMTAAFKDVTFNANNITAENGFGFYGADFIIDLDLDVYFIEPQHGCGLDEDHQFRVEMHNAIFTEMISATEEIWDRQEAGLPLRNGDLRNHGDYEIVYNNGWMYEYEGYKRSKNKKSCSTKQSRLNLPGIAQAV